MGYYVRVLALDAAPVRVADLKDCLPSGLELTIESGQENAWTELILTHKDGPDIALVERNEVATGELGEEEIREFMEQIAGQKPATAASWLANFLPRISVIYAFQLLSGTDVRDGWKGVHALQTHLKEKLGGILQADAEGFTNEDGYQILWQFTHEHDAEWEMAVLESTGEWVAFRMNLGDPKHREAFQNGRVPAGVKLLSKK